MTRTWSPDELIESPDLGPGDRVPEALIQRPVVAVRRDAPVRTRCAAR
jgi:hypothetical protein